MSRLMRSPRECGSWFWDRSEQEPPGLASAPRDAGFPVDVESEYLPEHLLDHGWSGEFLV